MLRWTYNTDERLARRAAAGDESAFTEIFRSRQGGVYGFALQMCGSPAAAEDITQEVFVTFARELASYDPRRAALSTYLYGIARNLVLRALEKAGAEAELDGETANATPCPNGGPLEELLREERIEAVRRSVLALPRLYREAVVLCDLQEMSYAEAAEVLECPVGTVRSRLARGRALLYEKLQTAKGCCV